MVPKRQLSGRHTAKLAIQILKASDLHFQEPSRKERVNLSVAFAKKGMVLDTDAFDLVRCDEPVNLSDSGEVERRLNQISIYEVKSTRLVTIGEDLRNYFFSLSTAELLAAQNLKSHYQFAFVNIATRKHQVLTLSQLLSKARLVYPEWAIRF